MKTINAEKLCSNLTHVMEMLDKEAEQSVGNDHGVTYFSAQASAINLLLIALGSAVEDSI